MKLKLHARFVYNYFLLQYKEKYLRLMFYHFARRLARDCKWAREILGHDGEGAPAGVGLPAAVQTLSAVVEPAPLSTSVVALHVVQLVHAFWLVAVENVPVGHATQVRSELLVPLVEIYSPAIQFAQWAQENWFVVLEY